MMMVMAILVGCNHFSSKKQKPKNFKDYMKCKM